MIALKERLPELIIVPAHDMGAFSEMPTLSQASSDTDRETRRQVQRLRITAPETNKPHMSSIRKTRLASERSAGRISRESDYEYKGKRKLKGKDEGIIPVVSPTILLLRLNRPATKRPPGPRACVRTQACPEISCRPSALPDGASQKLRRYRVLANGAVPRFLLFPSRSNQGNSGG